MHLSHSPLVLPLLLLFDLTIMTMVVTKNMIDSTFHIVIKIIYIMIRE